MRICMTGATGGLGFEIAGRLAEKGNRLGIIARVDGPGSDALRTRIGQTHVFTHADMRNEAQLAFAAGHIVTALGGIDAFVHLAGPIHFRRLINESPAGFQEMFAANTLSAAILSHAFLPAMREQKFGRCIFFGMTGSAVTRPALGLGAYGAAKAALVAYARSMAIEEAANGITSNVIEPGDIREKGAARAQAYATAAGNPSGHAGSWEDICAAIEFLLSDGAAFVNGAVLAVGGGLIDASE